MYTEEEKDDYVRIAREQAGMPVTSFQQDMINRFSYHAPKDDITKHNHEIIREQCLKLTSYINSCVPDGREKALAITKLEEVMMWANAGIARNG